MGIILHLIVPHPGTQPGRVLGRNYPVSSWVEICTVLADFFITQPCLCTKLVVVSVGDLNSLVQEKQRALHLPFWLLFKVREWLPHTATEGRMK